jgi:TolA-binding protein
MRKTLGAVALAGLVILGGAQAGAAAPMDMPAECVPYVTADSDGFVGTINYLVSQIEGLEQQIGNLHSRIDGLRDANHIKRQTIRRLRHRLAVS